MRGADVILDDTARKLGVEVGGTTADGAILPGGPAQKAGIKPGDLIIEFGGKAINNPDELIVAIRARSIGDRVEVKYKRGSSTRSTTVTLTAGKN